MAISHEIGRTPREYAEQVLSQSRQLLQEAVSITFPETPDVDPILAFPKPKEIRAEDSGIPKLIGDRRTLLLEKAGELGFGRAESVNLSEQGFTGATVIVEGGQPHKMLAEAMMVINDEAAQPKSIFFSASPHREIKNQGEIDSAQRLFGRVGQNEYNVAVDVVRALPGFTAYYEPRILDAAYDINENNTVSRNPSGQFQVIGEINGVEVILMQINRVDLPGGKYEKQPTTADVIGIIDRVTKNRGDSTSAIVHVTSGTYRPSRTVSAAIAGLSAERLVGVATYGNDLLNEIKGDNAPAPVNQLPGELNEMALQTNKLDEALGS
jgi:hypothetical protein